MRAFISSGEWRDACVPTLIAATDMAAPVAHRHRDRAQPDLEFLVEQREAGGAHLRQHLAQLGHGRDRAVGALDQLHARQVGLERVVRQVREQDWPIEVQYAGRRVPTSRLIEMMRVSAERQM